MWAEILEKFIKNEKLRNYYSLKGKQRANDFDIQKIIEKWEEILSGK